LSRESGDGRRTARFFSIENCSGNGPSGDQTVDDYDYCDNEKKVYEPAANVDHEEAKYPQDQQNHRDRPEH
jgi:hypothetical protein